MRKRITKATKLKDLSVEFISIVPSGANQKQIIHKDENGVQSLQLRILKQNEELRMVYGIVYSPGTPETEDTQGDFMEAEEIRKTAFDFMANARIHNVDSDHDFDAGQGFVAESWITKSEGDLKDPLFPEEPEGSWAVGIYVKDDEVWEGVKSGEYNGLSMAGVGVRETVEKKMNFLEKAQEIIKGVKENYSRRKLWDLVYAFTDAIWEVMNDEEITDKKEAVKAQVTEFTALLDTEVLKSTIGKDGTENLKKAHETLGALLGGTEQDEEIEKMTDKNQTPSQDTSEENVEKAEGTPEVKKADDIAAIVKSAVTDAVKPLEDRITKLEGSPASTKTSEEVNKSEEEIPHTMFLG
jgi:hypothetical protein